MISSDLNKSKEDGRETDPVCMEIVRYNDIQRIIKLHTFDILWKLINSTKKFSCGVIGNISIVHVRNFTNYGPVS